MPRLKNIHIEGLPGSLVKDFSFDSVTAILGDNGSGKTHIIEAIHRAAGGELSYRTEVQKKDFSITMLYENDDLIREYRFSREKGAKELFVQGKKISGIKYMEQLSFRTVLFSPFDMNLLYFAPSFRRDSIDSILRRAFSQFAQVKREYDEILRQRNALLKQIRDDGQDQNNLDFWDNKLAASATTYLQYRFKWVEYIQLHIEQIRSALSPHQISFEYITKSSQNHTEDGVLNLLKTYRSRDIIVGHTTVGPHLDDFKFIVQYDSQSFDAADFLSRGENKLLLLTLKYLEISFLEERTQKNMLLLFDDLFAELDEGHINEVMDNFQKYQIIYTTQRTPDFLKKNRDFTCINLTLP